MVQGSEAGGATQHYINPMVQQFSHHVLVSSHSCHIQRRIGFVVSQAIVGSTAKSAPLAETFPLEAAV